MSNQQTSKIGVTTATIIGMNAMIGAGIFAAPASLAANVGPAGILVYFFVVVAVWFMADSLAKVASLYPEEGSFYTYTKPWGGHTMGIIAICAYFIGLVIAMGLLSQVAGFYLTYFFPMISPHALGLIALLTLVILNMFGVAFSQLGQHILIGCTLFPLLATTLLCFTKADISNLTPFAPYGFTNLFKALPFVIFGFFGFESAASLFNIVENPEKNVPKALTYSITIVGIVYILFISSIIVSTPLSLFAKDIQLPDVLIQVFPGYTWLIGLIYFSILSAILGTVHSMIWGVSHLLITIAKKLQSPWTTKLLTSGKLNAKSSVLLVGACISITYLTLKNLNLFFNFTSLFIVFAFITSMITLLTLKKEWKSGQNIKTIIGIGMALIIFGVALLGVIQELLKAMN